MYRNGPFKKHYSRLVWEGILKALIFGLIVGFAAGLIFSVCSFAANGFATVSNFVSIASTALKTSLIAAGCLVGATALTAPLFYFWLFRPKAKQIAERVDRLGLEERLITMIDLEKDESYIAMIQREDAKAKLGTVSGRRLKLAVFMLVPVIAVSAVALAFITMTTMSALSVQSPIEWHRHDPREKKKEDPPDDKEYTYWWVEYLVSGGGYIDGDEFQVVVDGENATKVTAIAFEGFGFAYWLSGWEEPVKHDLDVREDRVDIAFFYPLSEDAEDDGDGDQDQPLPNEGGEDKFEFDPNRVIDGTIYYREEEIFEEYLARIHAMLTAGEELPQELHWLLELYFYVIT
ncbi:MAG: hypothetical protein FWE84_00590 [Firmicutes bacterium]|nr:hypothetical protein [Bacillota bacterium]